MKKRSMKYRTINRLFLLIVIILLVCSFLWGLYKPLPQGISVASELHTMSNDSISFLGDITYQIGSTEYVNQTIFEHVFEQIDVAQEFIVIDMFLFTNEFYDNPDLIPLADLLTQKLIEAKQNNPSLQIVFITDHFNTLYGSQKPQHIMSLENATIPVVYTNVNKLRNSNPLYSMFWDLFWRPLGIPNYNTQLFPNIITSEPQHMGIRSLFKLLNFKANHRKVFITEDTAIIMSANPHIGSSLHSNVGLLVNDSRIISDLLLLEQSVISFSDSTISLPQKERYSTDLGNNTLKVGVITEGKIRDAVIEQINTATNESQIDIAMFYFSDRLVTSALKDALSRGVKINILLDPNKDAFGREKNGIPNRQVAKELVESGANIRWYNTHGEQFHTKMFLKTTNDDVVLILGSANYTKRNIGDYNLETNLIVFGSVTDRVMIDARAYIDFANSDVASLDYDAYEDPSFIRYVLYRFQEWSGLSSF